VAIAAPAVKPPETKTCKVTFVFLEPNAKRVAVCGAFNGWAANAAPMTRRPDGLWETTLALAPGRYEYKFLVDGIWIPDPAARENVWNYHGTLNSVVEVRA
jgi:1,4-alpha-glucan branching enzyme